MLFVCSGLEGWDYGDLGRQDASGEGCIVKAAVRGVDQIYSTSYAFAAVFKDGMFSTLLV